MKTLLRLALAVSLIIGCMTTAIADGLVTSSVMVPVDGLVFHPGGTLESIALTGRMHLVTQIYPNDFCLPQEPCKVFVDLADVKGIGLPSGNSYVAIGAVMLPFASPDPPPITPTFVIMPVTGPSGPPIVPPSPIMPITFSVRLAFDQSGHLSPDAIVVQLPGCTTDICQ